MIKTKRVYERPDEKDGIRILVDRLWPRGLKKDEAKIDFWAKNISPSEELRKWFSHDPNKWEEFKQKYFEELKRKEDEIKNIIEIIRKNQNVTLLYATKETKYNNATALKEYLEKKFSGG